MKYSYFSILIISVIIISCNQHSSDWHPNSSDLLFMSNANGNADLYLKKGSDTTWVNLTKDPAGDNWGVWSPDGKSIVFQSTRSGNLDIWLMNSDGSNPVQLTTNEDYDYLPSFTPDGKSITFTSWRKEKGDEEKLPHIYIMSSDGKNQKRLIKESLNTSAGAVWHPNGQKFIITRKIDEKGADIFEVDKSGEVLSRLTNDTLYSSASHYSPDGSKILYTNDHSSFTDICLMNSDGTNSRVILSGDQNYYPRFSPDGDWIVYTNILPETEGKDLDIYAVSLNDTYKKILLARSNLREAEGSWRP